MRSSELCNFEMSASQGGEKILEVIRKELRRGFRLNRHIGCHRSLFLKKKMRLIERLLQMSGKRVSNMFQTILEDPLKKIS